MKITILVNLFPPIHLGGTEIATYSLAEELVKRGHQIHILTSSDSGLTDGNYEKGFYIHRFRLKSNTRFLGTVYFWFKIFFCIMKINPDIIHAQSLDIAMPAFIAKKVQKLPYIVYSRCSPSLFPKSSLRLVKFALENADLILTLTNDMKVELRQLYNLNNIKVIANGVKLEKFRFNKPTSIANIILCVARLRPEKGLEYLIRSMKIITETKPETKLFLVGDGPEEEFLSKLVKKMNLDNNIIFVGKIRNELIHKYYSEADVFVLPSLSEGFPVSLLEAMASGMPIIATNVCGVPEFIEEGRNGFLVNPKDPKDIADKVLMVLKDFELRKRIALNNKNDSKNYDLNEVVNRLENVYYDIL